MEMHNKLNGNAWTNHGYLGMQTGNQEERQVLTVGRILNSKMGWWNGELDVFSYVRVDQRIRLCRERTVYEGNNSLLAEKWAVGDRRRECNDGADGLWTCFSSLLDPATLHHNNHMPQDWPLELFLTEETMYFRRFTRPCTNIPTDTNRQTDRLSKGHIDSLCLGWPPSSAFRKKKLAHQNTQQLLVKFTSAVASWRRAEFCRRTLK